MFFLHSNLHVKLFLFYVVFFSKSGFEVFISFDWCELSMQNVLIPTSNLRISTTFDLIGNLAIDHSTLYLFGCKRRHFLNYLVPAGLMLFLGHPVYFALLD